MPGPTDVKVTFLVEAATQAAIAALDNYKKKTAEVTAQVERDGQANTRSINAQVAAGKALASANDFVAQQTRKAADAIRSESSAATGAATAVRDASNALRAHGAEAESAAGKVEKVGHSSTGVRRELIVLAHEMSQGNYSRFAGSMLVLGERVDALGKIMSPVGLAAVVFLAAIGSVAVAAVEGAIEVQKLNDALRLTGGFAGVTRGEYDAMATGIATSTDGKIAQARATLLTLVESGRFVAISLVPVARAVTDVAEASGKSAEDVVGDFIKMSDGVVKWATEHNKQYHFLTLAEFDYIKSLEETGQQQKAVAVTADLLSSSLESQKKPLTGLSALWHELGTTINTAWDSMKGIGKADTLEQSIAKAKEALAEAKTIAGGATPFTDAGRQQLFNVGARQEELDKLLLQQKEQGAKARADATKKEHDQEQIDAVAFFDKLADTTHAGRQKQAEKEIADIKRNAALLKGTRDEISQADQDEQIAAVREKYADPKPTGQRTPSGDNADSSRILKAQLDNQLAELNAAVSRREETEAAALATSAELWAAHYAAVIKSLETAVAAAGTPAVRARLSSELEAVRTEALAKDAELQAKLTQLTQKGEDDRQKILGETSKSAGDVKAAELARIDASYQDWIEKLRTEGVADWKRLADDWKAEQLRAVDVEALKRQIEEVQAELGRQQSRIQVQVQTGNLTKSEGSTNLEAASARASQELVQLRAQLQALFDEDPKNAKLGKYIDDLGVKIEQLPTKARSPMEVMFSQWRDTTTAMEQASANWIDKSVDGLTQFVTTGKFQINEFVRSILADFAKIQFRSAVAGFAGIGSSGGGSGGGGIAGAIGAVATAAAGSNSAPPTADGSGGSSDGSSGLSSAAAALKGAAAETSGAAGQSSGSAGQWGLLSTVWNAAASFFGLTQTSAAETSSFSLTDAAEELVLAAFALTDAAEAEQIAATASSFAGGGSVIGPGTGTSDSIPAWLSHGEYVINAATVSRLGTSYLDRINAGAMPHSRALTFATGGLVSQSFGASGSVGIARGDVHINTPINVTVPESSSRQDADRISRETARQIAAAVRSVISEEQRPGGSLAHTV